MRADNAACEVLGESVTLRVHMTVSVQRSGWRRAGLYLLILLALSLVSTVAVVVGRDDQLYDVENVFPEPVTVNAEKQPRFKFPDDLRTEDLELNRFIDRFFRLAGQARYSEVKLMISQRTGDELLPDRFQTIFNATQEVRIRSIRRLPDLPEAEGPSWLLMAEYDLEPYAPRSNKKNNRVRMCVAKEGGGYRIGPFSHEDYERLAAFEARAAQAASQPTEKPATQPAEPAESGATGDGTAGAREADPGSTEANRPLRLDD